MHILYGDGSSRQGLVLALTGCLAFQIGQSTSGYRVLVRNFYGGLRVRDSGPATQLDATRTLTNGTINHGEQFLNPARRDQPTTYYGPDTGVGLAIREKGKAAGEQVSWDAIFVKAAAMAAVPVRPLIEAYW